MRSILAVIANDVRVAALNIHLVYLRQEGSCEQECSTGTRVNRITRVAQSKSA